MCECEYVIEPRGKWFRIPWREIVEYRDLLFVLVRRELVSRYKQTILGPLWFILNPLLMSVVFTVVFGQVARLPTDGVPHLAFYLCGMLGWRYFSLCMTGTSATFVTNAALFGKVYFPRLVVPLSVVVSNLLAFVIQLGTFLPFWVYFASTGEKIHATWFLLLLPVFLVQSGAIGLGVGLWMSALTAKYRDFVHLTDFLVQIWFYATPVVYPLSLLPEHRRWIAALNPMTGIVESFKYAFLGSGTVESTYLWISGGTTGLLLVSGILVFSRVERTFIDTV